MADSSVVVDLVDHGGNEVAGPLAYSSNPSQGVAINGSGYRANLSTKGVAPGSYTLRARFSSASLQGQLDLPMVLH